MKVTVASYTAWKGTARNPSEQLLFGLTLHSSMENKYCIDTVGLITFGYLHLSCCWQSECLEESAAQGISV